MTKTHIRGVQTKKPLVKLMDGAALVRKHPRTLRRWIREGKLNGWRVSGHIHVDPDEVLQLMEPQLMRPCTDGDAA